MRQNNAGNGGWDPSGAQRESSEMELSCDGATVMSDCYVCGDIKSHVVLVADVRLRCTNPSLKA